MPVKIQKIYKLSDKIKFGKYKGTTIALICKSNHNYLIWCLDNIKGFRVEQEVYQEIELQRSKYTRIKRYY